jgi:signal transduction histidine kinase
MISVTDTGPGIPAEDLASLFQPFVHIRSNDSLKRQAGVGLHLSQHIMKLFDGDIKVKSTVGLGSKFWLEFPIYLVPEQDAIITEDSIL